MMIILVLYVVYIFCVLKVYHHSFISNPLKNTEWEAAA
jgi:hypothetical protein